MCVCVHNLFKWKIVAAKFKRFWNLVILLYMVIAPSFVFGCWFCIFSLFRFSHPHLFHIFRSLSLCVFIIVHLSITWKKTSRVDISYKCQIESVRPFHSLICECCCFFSLVSFISSILKTENCQLHCWCCGYCWFSLSLSLSFGYWAHFVS